MRAILLDTAEDIRASLNETLAAFGYPPVSGEQTRAYVGNGARRLLERALPAGADTDAALDDFRVRYASSAHLFTRPYEGVEQTLLRLKEKYRLAVVTNKPQEAADSVVAKFFPGVFDYVGGDGAFPCKPDPSHARYAALVLRAAPADCLFVGDGETDAVTAKRAGMRFAGALWGYRSRETLAAAGATVFCERFSDLEKICENS